MENEFKVEFYYNDQIRRFLILPMIDEDGKCYKLTELIPGKPDFRGIQITRHKAADKPEYWDVNNVSQETDSLWQTIGKEIDKHEKEGD
jgi:hypothetical protein